jgi:hypothetical protein
VGAGGTSLASTLTGVTAMKTTDQSNVVGRQKPKKQKRAIKTRLSASIAERYLELRQLRERVSEAESRLYAR